MADQFIGTADLTQVTTAYEALSYFKFRAQLYFDRLATVKPTNQTHVGGSVLFNIYNDLAPAITPLSETVDVTPVETTDDEVTISLNEYGNVAQTTARLRGLSYLPVQSDIANIMGFNAGLSFDSLARNVLVAGSNVFYGNASAGPRNTLTTTHTLKAVDIRNAVARLSDNEVPTLDDGMYRAFAAASVLKDLREETGGGSWRNPHEYAQPEQIWKGEIGEFEGVAFMATSRLTAGKLETANGGPGGFINGGLGGTADVFPVLIMGEQALAKTWSRTASAEIPQIVLGEVTDKLKRFVPIGWYWLGGFGRFREESLYRIEVTTSLYGTAAPTT